MYWLISCNKFKYTVEVPRLNGDAGFLLFLGHILCVLFLYQKYISGSETEQTNTVASAPAFLGEKKRIQFRTFDANISANLKPNLKMLLNFNWGPRWVSLAKKSGRG